MCPVGGKAGRHYAAAMVLSAPTSSEAALLVQQANCPKAQPPLSLLQSGIHNEANLETRNQAGA